jgi:hypothetical protein
MQTLEQPKKRDLADKGRQHDGNKKKGNKKRLYNNN